MCVFFSQNLVPLLNSMVVSARESKILIEKNNRGIRDQEHALTVSIITIGALLLCIIIGSLALKLSCSRHPQKSNYSHANYRPPPARKGLFQGFRPSSPVSC